MPRTLSAPKRILFPIVAFVLVVGLLETGARVYFASVIGRSVLWYGTPFEREAVEGGAEQSTLAREIRERRLRGVDDRFQSIRHPEQLRESYFKYEPYQHRVTFDIDTGEVYPATINARGFRGGDFPTEKAPGVLRVVTLGASSTFGYHNRDDRTYPSQLQDILDRRCPGQAYEVLNLGIPHLTSSHIRALFLAEGVALRPDIVTFYEGYNDAMEMDEKVSASDGTRSWPKRLKHWARDHILLAALESSLEDQWTKRFPPDSVEARQAAKEEVFLGNLARIDQTCRELGATFIVASQQSRSMTLLREDLGGVSADEEVRRIRDRVKRKGYMNRKEMGFLSHAEMMKAEARWVRQRGIPFVDVRAALDDRRDQIISWVHLSHDANRILAGKLAEKILALSCPGGERNDEVGTATASSPRPHQGGR